MSRARIVANAKDAALLIPFHVFKITRGNFEQHGIFVCAIELKKNTTSRDLTQQKKIANCETFDRPADRDAFSSFLDSPPSNRLRQPHHPT
jgi:hypothetical protein